MAEYSTRRNSNTQLLEELEALSRSLYQSHTSNAIRRTASLVLPRTSLPAIPSPENEIGKTSSVENKTISGSKTRSRRMSLSPWRSRSKLEEENEQRGRAKTPTNQSDSSKFDDSSSSTEKKGLWNWKPIRVLSHIGMNKMSCLFSVEVASAQGLPSSMNGLRLSVCIRKKETKDGAVQTMPARVSQGAADFEETLFFRCHVYCNGGKQLKFEPRPFWIYAFAVDAQELDFGRGSLDLSKLIQESIEKSHQGIRIRQWDKSFNLYGKAKGGELVLKVGFQIMDDGGIGIYNQGEVMKSGKSGNYSSFARKQSKTSFSVPSPKMTSRMDAWTPSQRGASNDLREIDDLNLDEPEPVKDSSTSTQKVEKPHSKIEDAELPDFEVVDKGIEVQDREGEEESEKSMEVKSATSEVVKEVVQDQLHLLRLSELDSIAQQIKALESMMGDRKSTSTHDDTESQRLDADEETVTREFLNMLEHEGLKEYGVNEFAIPLQHMERVKDSNKEDSKDYLPDLGKGLGCVVQTRDGGFLASTNSSDTAVGRKDTPKLAMQMSKPFVLPSQQASSGFELLQKMASVGFDEFSSQILSLMSMDELMGKTAEQIAFEGIASAIIQGRNKEGASSRAARTVAALKSMANAMSAGRKERITTGLWNVSEEPLAVEELLAFSMQKLESMAIEALKIQAEMAEEDAPFDVSTFSIPRLTTEDQKDPLAEAISLEDWIKKCSDNLDGTDNETGEAAEITVMVVVQMRDPVRRYEAVGGPILVFIHAASSGTKGEEFDEEKRYKVSSLHIGGLKVRTAVKKNAWDTEKKRLTAKQWLVANGLGKAGKKAKPSLSKGPELLWSISSRIMANMWLKPIRNPDIKFAN